MIVDQLSVNFNNNDKTHRKSRLRAKNCPWVYVYVQMRTSVQAAAQPFPFMA
jgi:hypothetical protein